MAEAGENGWKDVLLGLQEKLDVTQFELLRRVGLKPVFQVSEWINGKRPVPKGCRTKILDFAVSNGIDIVEIADFGRLARSGLKVDGVWLPKENAHGKESLSGGLINKISDGVLVSVQLLFPCCYKGKSIQFIESGVNFILSHEDERKYDVRFHGFKNLEKAVARDLFRFHPTRSEKMFSGFEKLKRSHIPNLNKERMLEFLKAGPLSTAEIQVKTGLKLGNTKKHLTELRKLGRVESSKESDNTQIVWFLK